MISLADVITRDTPITFVRKIPDKAYEFHDDSEKIIFAKNFSVNEFIGEKLAKVRNLRSLKYFLVLENDSLGKCCYGELDSSKIENIKIGSYDFRENGYSYWNINELGVGDNGFYKLLYLCANKQNRLELTNDLLEMFALDTYMAQADRLYYNITIKRDEHRNIRLAPIYDFIDSFSEDANIYFNTLASFPTYREYEGYIGLFPQFAEMLETYLNVDLVEEIKEIFEEKKLNYCNMDFQFYRDFSKKRKNDLRKILK